MGHIKGTYEFSLSAFRQQVLDRLFFFCKFSTICLFVGWKGDGTNFLNTTNAFLFSYTVKSSWTLWGIKNTHEVVLISLKQLLEVLILGE